MYLFKNVSSLSLKLINDEKKCIGSCVGCFESQNVQSKGFNNLYDIDNFLYKVNDIKIIDIKTIDSISFYGTSIFNLFSIEDITKFLYKYNNLNFKFQVDLNNYDFLAYLKANNNYDFLNNVTLYLFKSYDDDLNTTLLLKYINFFQDNSIDYLVDISINTDTYNVEDIKNELGTNINIRENILIKDSKVLNLKKCSIINSFTIKGSIIILQSGEYKSLFLDFITNGDIQIHNLPCHWGSITISNIYKQKKEILKDFIKFKIYLSRYIGSDSDNFGHKCYNCFNKIKYNYRKIS